MNIHLSSASENANSVTLPIKSVAMEMKDLPGSVWNTEFSVWEHTYIDSVSISSSFSEFKEKGRASSIPLHLGMLLS